MRLQDYFYYVEQAVSIGTKGVIMDFLADGTGIAFGEVAETSGYAEFGWPLKLSEPLDIESGGTGASTAAGAIAALGGVKKSGDTMTGNLTIQGYLYPSVYLTPYYNSTTNRTVFEGSYVGASSFASWEDSTGNNRRMLEVRTKGYEASLDNAVMLRVADAGVWSNYRVFHAGMPSGVPVANGGTGATTAANARSNLGANNASNLITGTIPAARLPFKVAYGSGSVSGSSALTINYSSARIHFCSPCDCELFHHRQQLVRRQRRIEDLQQNDHWRSHHRGRQLQHKQKYRLDSDWNLSHETITQFLGSARSQYEGGFSISTTRRK